VSHIIQLDDNRAKDTQIASGEADRSADLDDLAALGRPAVQ
jgi:hypothetical protein